jgi:hypothetical protein
MTGKHGSYPDSGKSAELERPFNKPIWRHSTPIDEISKSEVAGASTPTGEHVRSFISLLASNRAIESMQRCSCVAFEAMAY